MSYMEQQMKSQIEGALHEEEHYYEILNSKSFEELENEIFRLENNLKDSKEYTLSTYFVEKNIEFIKSLKKYQRGNKIKNILK